MAQTERAWLGWASLVAGCAMGMATSTWQMAIETAQVQAGLIPGYPADNAFYVYHLKMWTLCVQLPALLMVLGTPERIANLLLTGVVGAISFAGLSGITFALSRQRLLSFVAPFVIVSAELYQLGSTYFIAVLDSVHTFGVLGTAYGVLLLAALGLGRERLVAGLLGLAPAVHPSIGAWLWGVFGLTLVWEHPRLRERIRVWRVPFLMGVGVTALSFTHHLWLGQRLPAIDPADGEQYLRAFTATWDDHRRPVPPLTLGIYAALLTLAMAFLWLHRFREDITESARSLLRAIIVSATLALICSGLSHFQPQLPLMFSVAMPWRNLNITNLAFPSLLLGFMARTEVRIQRPLLLLPFILTAHLIVIELLPMPSLSLMVVAPIVTLALRFWYAPAAGTTRDEAPRLEPAMHRKPWLEGVLLGIAVLTGAGALHQYIHYGSLYLLDLFGPVTMSFLGGVGVLGIMCWSVQQWMQRRSQASPLQGEEQPRPPVLPHAEVPPPVRTRPFALVTALTSGVLGLTLLNSLLDGGQAASAIPTRLGDWTNTTLYTRLSQQPGMTITGGALHLIQLRSRKPVLLHILNLNTLPYVLESGPDMQRTLRGVYHIDLFHPPGRRAGGLSRSDAKGLFEARDPIEWAKLGQEFGFGSVVTPRDWILKLPLLEQSDEMNLYAVESSPQRPTLTAPADR